MNLRSLLRRGKVLTWTDRVQQDMKELGVDETLEAVMETCKAADERGLSAEAKSALKWNGFCWWALPRSLAVVQDELRLVDGLYFRSWVCELNGVAVDGHVYVNEGSGCCQQCGE